MARVCFVDCPSGVAGDMLLGALLDCGMPAEALRAGLAALDLPGWRLEAGDVRRGGFRATKVDVVVEAREHPHRRLGEIRALLGVSRLEPEVRARSLSVFERLAAAEARAHGESVDAVVLHDVGAIDALIDVVGVVLALRWLEIDELHASALPLGGGVVDGPHGPIAVPGPGTAELLRGVPVVDTGVRAELVTPTGAALLATLARGFGRMPAMVVELVGSGAGARELPGVANIVRCFVGAPLEAATAPADTPGEESVVEIETTIDDMSPQLYAPLVERLLAAGALDVTLTPVIMKRGRPGVVVGALCAPDVRDGLVRALFEESTTLGVRWSDRRRRVLAREVVTVESGYGPVACKIGRLDGRVVTATPEFSDASRLAALHGLPVREVLEAARVAARTEAAARRHDGSAPGRQVGGLAGRQLGDRTGRRPGEGAAEGG